MDKDHEYCDDDNDEHDYHNHDVDVTDYNDADIRIDLQKVEYLQGFK